jgi:hypothetical protein
MRIIVGFADNVGIENSQQGLGMNWESAAPAGVDEKSESYLALKLDVARASNAEV